METVIDEARLESDFRVVRAEPFDAQRNRRVELHGIAAVELNIGPLIPDGAVVVVDVPRPVGVVERVCRRERRNVVSELDRAEFPLRPEIDSIPLKTELNVGIDVLRFEI